MLLKGKADIKINIEAKAETDKNNIMPEKKKRTVTQTKTKSSGKVVKRKTARREKREENFRQEARIARIKLRIKKKKTGNKK